MTSDLATPNPVIPRDDKKRPLIKPVGRLNAKPVAYTRCTTFIECLDSTYTLEKWKMRMVALGLADSPELVLSVAAHRDDKKELDSITWRATEVAKASAAATTGTSLHKLTEKLDRGEPLGRIPEAYVNDIMAYQKATRHMRMLDIERFLVQDTLKVGGTPDRILQVGDEAYIGDVKTGEGAITYGQRAISMQLAIYARSLKYDPVTGRRSPLPDNLNTSKGIIIHLPAGQGVADLYWVDLDTGWEAVALAARVRQWRNRRDLVSKIDPLVQAIWNVASMEELDEVWRTHRGGWTDLHTQLAVARKRVLQGAAQA